MPIKDYRIIRPEVLDLQSEICTQKVWFGSGSSDSATLFIHFNVKGPVFKSCVTLLNTLYILSKL